MISPVFRIEEIDLTEIESFVRREFEERLGKDKVLGTYLFVYPNEYAIAVSVSKRTEASLKTAHELQQALLDRGLAVMVYVREGNPKP